MRSWCFALVVPMLLTACGSATNSATPPADVPGKVSSAKSAGAATRGENDAAPAAFAFGWKIPCRVPVEQFTEKNGSIARMRYVLALKQGPEGKLDGDMSDFEFLELDGRDLSPPEIQAQLAPALALTAALPTMVISREGEYIGMRGLEAMVERVMVFVGKGKKLSQAEQEKVNAAMRSPRMMATMERKMGDYWNSWVGAWVGLEIAPNEAREADDAIPLGDEDIPIRVRYEHNGSVKGAPKLVNVTMVSTMSGNSASAGILAFARAMMKDGGMELPGNMTVDYVNVVMKVEAETEAATLRPRKARSTRSTEIVIDGKRTTKREIREDSFDWDHAQGCF